MLKRKIKRLFGILSGRYKKCYSRMWQEGLTSMGCYGKLDNDIASENFAPDCECCPYLISIHPVFRRLIEPTRKGENHNGD